MTQSAAQQGHRPLYRAAQIRAVDRRAIEEFGVDSFSLMTEAGTAAFNTLRDQWPRAQRLHIVCGTGNNGGDGWIIARLGLLARLGVTATLVGDPSRVTGDAKRALDDFLAAGGLLCAAPSIAEDTDLIVDAVLGTGFTGATRTEVTEWIQRINRHPAPTLAIDIPSGLNADTGCAQPCAVQADITITFIGLKQGLHTGSAADYVGHVIDAPLSVPRQALDTVQPVGQLLSLPALIAHLPPRKASDHKGHYGHVLVVGGNTGMGGAAILAAEGALRTGAGLVSLATRAETVTAALARRPEIMARAVQQPQDIDLLLTKVDVVIIGPGLGTDRWAQLLLGRVLDAQKATVFDADALNLLAKEGLPREPLPPMSVMTPHPGEAARLLGSSNRRITSDRFEALTALVQCYGTTTLLKGVGTLIASPTRDDIISICPYGNAGMATGGMGDVLSGIIGALLARRLEPRLAAELAACLHGKAGDIAAERGNQSALLPTDILHALSATGLP